MTQRGQSQKAQTKDQRFIVELYQKAKKAGDIYAPFSRYEVGYAVGLQDLAINTICKLLLQANFIRKEDDEKVYLTKNGENLALSFLS